ncbi:MAG: hypothetical protein Q8M99_06960 [Methylotenera sp.]|nr:hypothetical protein [Methylotenera sp.]
MNTTQTTKHIIFAVIIAFLMLLTRGSHVLTSVSLPDASLALLLIGGLYLRKAAWFVFFVLLATLIDFSASAINSWYGFCLTAGYWGMLPTYFAMWLAGVWLSKQTDGLDIVKYTIAGLLATFLAFVISTQTYYLFSGRFPNNGISETMQYGWDYFPSYIGFTAMYLVAFLALAKVLPKFNLAGRDTLAQR